MRFYGQFTPPVDQFIFERYFGRSLLSGTYLECGASDGVGESSGLFFAETLGWKAVNVEASPPLFEMLVSRRPDALNIHAALSDTVGTIQFTHAYHPRLGVHFGNGSVAHVPSHRAELDAMNCTYQTFEFPQLTYRALIEEHAIDRIDLMILDVEGHELAALRGMTDCAVLPAVLCVEHGHAGASDINDVMSSMGYMFDIVSFANTFYVRKDKVGHLRRQWS